MWLSEFGPRDSAPRGGEAVTTVVTRWRPPAPLSQTRPMWGPADRARASSPSTGLGGLRGPVALGDPMPAATRAQMLAQELAGLRIDQADVQRTAGVIMFGGPSGGKALPGSQSTF